MVTINFLENFDLFQHLDEIVHIRSRRGAIEDILKNSDISKVLPEGAVLLPDDRITAENPDPSLCPRLSVPFVVGCKYYVKGENHNSLAYFLAAVKVGDEEKLLLSKTLNRGSELCCSSKKEMILPEDVMMLTAGAEYLNVG
ncbi:MAG: hypothetical protein NTW67_01925 [Candidatus Woesearchaeota archaeon]|nr:hypothetical protein [Candidatus Woesearchaeota archaeon]